MRLGEWSSRLKTQESMDKGWWSLRWSMRVSFLRRGRRRGRFGHKHVDLKLQVSTATDEANRGSSGIKHAGGREGTKSWRLLLLLLLLMMLLLLSVHKTVPKSTNLMLVVVKEELVRNKDGRRSGRHELGLGSRSVKPRP